MATVPLAVDYDDIRREIALAVGWDRDPANWLTDQAADAEACIRSGLLKFYYPVPTGGHAHRWSFLMPMYDLQTTAPYSTGTVEIINGGVAGTGVNWAPYSATLTDAWFILDGVRYSIASYTDYETFTLDDTSLDADAGSSYELKWWRYTLPSSFAGLEGDLTFRPGETNEYHTLRRVPEIRIRELYQADWVTVSDEPQMYSLVPVTFDAAAGQRWYIYLYPESFTEQLLQCRMRVNPETLDATDKYPLGGAEHADTILEAILSEVELKLMDRPGIHTEKFQRCLAASISHDQQTATPDFMPSIPQFGTQEYEDYRWSILRQGRATYVGYEHLM